MVSDSIAHQWTKHVFRGIAIGACTPSLAQLGGVILDLITIMKKGKTAQGLGVFDGIIETLFVSISQFQLLNTSLLIIFSMAGLVVGAMTGSFSVVWYHPALK